MVCKHSSLATRYTSLLSTWNSDRQGSEYQRQHLNYTKVLQGTLRSNQNQIQNSNYTVQNILNHTEVSYMTCTEDNTDRTFKELMKCRQ